MEKHYIRSLLIAVAVMGMVVFKLYRYQDKSERIKAANEAYYQGNFEQCKDMMIAYTEKYPDKTEGWAFLGTIYMEMDSTVPASEAYQKALEIDDENVKALVGLGVVRRMEKNRGEAEKLYYKAIEADPTYAKSYSSLSELEVVKRNFHKAVELGEKAVTLDPKDLGAKGNLMVAYHFAGEIEKKEKLYKELEQGGYKYLIYLDMLISGEVSLDNF